MHCVKPSLESCAQFNGTHVPTRLSDLSTFDGLLGYLQAELDWPIASLDVEELSFDYDPARELGLPADAAGRIDRLKQLRPIDTNQPWSIFYLAFERRYLPLRLVQLVLTSLCTPRPQRVDAAMQRLWQPRDLLIIAQSGPPGQARFDFAQCTSVRGRQRDVLLLGWHHDEPEERLEWVEAQVRAGLRWPAANDPDASSKWPGRWRETFLARRARPRPAWSELSKDHQRVLVDLYSAGDHTVDVLPYTSDFSWLLASFNAATGLSLTPHEFWRALSSARKGGHLPKKQRGLPN